MSEATRRVAAILHRAVEADRERIRWLDQVARGEIALSPTEREDLRAAERSVRAHLRRLAGEESEIIHRQRVVDLDPERTSREEIPRALQEAYSLLTHRAYGSDPAVSVGDANVIRGIGKAKARTSTSSPEGVGGGAPAATKKFGQSRRSVIRDRKAYEIKIRVDRRLRRLAVEIQEHLNGGQVETTVNVCSHCNRIGEGDWRYCPNCGGRMTTQDKEAS